MGPEGCTDVLKNLIKGGFVFLWYFSPDDMVNVAFDVTRKRGAEGADLQGKFGLDDGTVSLSIGKFVSNARTIQFCLLNFVGRRGTNQLRLLERHLDVLVKHTTEIPPPTALVEGTAPSALVEDVSLR